jgi:hypothetical protein
MKVKDILKKLKPNKDWDLDERDRWMEENDGKVDDDAVVVVKEDE